MLENKSDPKKPFEVTLKIENSIKLDPQNPIPIQYGGNSFYVVTGKKYIPFLGQADNFPSLLLEARLTSTTQNACISTIAKSVIGKGLTIVDNQNPNQEFIEWKKSVNNDGESYDEILENAIDGERGSGNQFIEITRGELAGKKFIKIYLHSILYCRLADHEKTESAKEVLISKLFAKKGYRAVDVKKTRRVPLWSDNKLDEKNVWLKNDDGTFSTMLHLKNEVSGIDDYGLPASIAGLRYQVLEGKSAQYNIDNFENNMVLGGMLIFKSAMTQDEANRNAKEILLSHVGEGKTGRIAVISSESGLEEIDWKPYETQKDGSYIELDKRIEEKIIAANGWDSILAGINRNSSLGNGSNYIRSIFDVKETMLLKPLRKKLIDKVVTPIAKIYAEWMGVKEILNYTYDFPSSMPFSFMADIDPDSFMKVKEARSLAGLEPDENNGEKYLCEMTSKKDVQTKQAAA